MEKWYLAMPLHSRNDSFIEKCWSRIVGSASGFWIMYCWNFVLFFTHCNYKVWRKCSLQLIFHLRRLQTFPLKSHSFVIPRPIILQRQIVLRSGKNNYRWSEFHEQFHTFDNVYRMFWSYAWIRKKLNIFARVNIHQEVRHLNLHLNSSFISIPL